MSFASISCIGRKGPDAQTLPRLKECISAVAFRVRQEVRPDRLIIGGRSMGGRGSLDAGGRQICLRCAPAPRYPLHPAGQPEKLPMRIWRRSRFLFCA